jgi:hypothetical protein
MWKRFVWGAAFVACAAAGAYGVACVNNDTAINPCPQYCSNIAATCTGNNTQYADDPTCERICAAIDAGTQGTPTGDTIACRDSFQSSAKDELTPDATAADCLNAGISSLCASSRCQAFCSADLALCGPALTGYNAVSDCVTACATWGQDFTGALIGSTGNTLECRTYHLELSQTGNADDLQTHCPHTGVVSARCFDTDAGTGDAGPAEAGPNDAASDAASE